MGSSDQKASNTLRVAIVAASGSVPPVKRLADGDDVGNDAGLLAGEHGSGASEAGEDLVEDQQQIVAVGEFAQAAQHGRVVEQHAARALHQRLDDDAGDLAGMALEHLRQRRRARVVRWQFDDVLRRQQAVKYPVHAGVIADGHRA